MSEFDWLQWAAAAATVMGAFHVGSTRRSRRVIGFVVFAVSNLLWVLWGWPRAAWGLVTLQVALMALNARGLAKNELAAHRARHRSSLDGHETAP